MSKRVLAFDFGASSGRAILGSFDGSKISLKEIHRFSNDPVMVGDTMYWDTLRLFHEMKQGMLKAKLDGGFDGIGIDTWGVDFGLVDSAGRLLENPIHYRDLRTQGMIEKSFEYLPKNRFYEITGNQFMELNTVFQLLSIREKRPELLERTDKMLLTPDLFISFLTGKKIAEYSIASTTQLMDAHKGEWSEEVLRALQLPARILPKIVQSGTIVGTLLPSIQEELGIENQVEVIAVAGHDTQSAMAAVPTQDKDFLFVSCGTWSLFGTELDAPLINEVSERLNITNEGGYGKKTSFLKNIIGLWLVQESRRQWAREGVELGFGDLEKLAEEAKPFKCFIDPDSPEFIPAGNIPERIREYCKKTGQAVPETKGEIVRTINESLALKYRQTIQELEECTGKTYPVIHMLGGGIQSKMLCRLTAGACKRRVCAGPIEATVYGNIALQLLALNEIQDIQSARQIIAASEPPYSYEVADSAAWDEAYERFQFLLK